jgi:hypothetical protein
MSSYDLECRRLVAAERVAQLARDARPQGSRRRYRPVRFLRLARLPILRARREARPQMSP